MAQEIYIIAFSLLRVPSGSLVLRTVHRELVAFAVGKEATETYFRRNFKRRTGHLAAVLFHCFRKASQPPVSLAFR